MTRLRFWGNNAAPIWGRYVIFSDLNEGICWMRADGSWPTAGFDPEHVRARGRSPGWPAAGLLRACRKKSIWTLPLEAQDGQTEAGKPEQFRKSESDGVVPSFSPGGNWPAYLSNALGKMEVYVRDLPPPGSGQAGQWQISNSGGSARAMRGVVWSRSGRELIYREGDQVMAVN
jgi:hypothetical protein